MSLMPVKETDFEEANRALELYSQNLKPHEIAKELGIRRVDVLNYIDDWKNSQVGSEVMRARAEELISSMDNHYSTLIRKAYEIIDEVDRLAQSDKETMTRSQMLSQKKGALDLIAKLEKDRIDILQKFGVTEFDALGDELAKMEDEKQIILDILANDLCGSCKPVVMGKIATMLNGGGKATVVVVND